MTHRRVGGRRRFAGLTRRPSRRQPAFSRTRTLAIEPLEQRSLLDAVSPLATDWSSHQPAAFSHEQAAHLDLTLVREPTALEDQTTGEVEALPDSLSWIDEWDWLFAEIWASTPGADDLGIASASVDLLYDTACFTAASIEYGPAFTETHSGSIDEAAGRIEDLGGVTLLADAGDDKYALLARVALEPTEGDPGLDHNAEGHYLQPLFDCGLRLEAAEVALVGTGTAGAEANGPADAELWPVMYDLDDDAQVGFGDLAYFATAFQQQVGQPDTEFAWASDFDRSGRVDVGDLSFFAEGFQRSRGDGSPMVYPSWIDTRGGLPADPADVAPALDLTVATSVASATEFLYTGADPIQTGVAPGTIEPVRAAVLRGTVVKRDDGPLRGVTVTILNHPEFGQTLSRADGKFDMAVNGGGHLTVAYERDGYLPVQRQIDVPWQDYRWLPDVVMVPLDPVVTTIDLTSSEPMQVARGSVMTDLDGPRQATILVPQGTQAEMVMPDGTTQPLTALNIRATEYTVGENGPQAMPAELPPTSGYTYCVEVTADEALAAGGADVRFDSPVYYYVEDFIGFPVGSAVPTGYYDRQVGEWVASSNGRVIEVLGITGGLAEVDTDGDGAADDPATLALLNVSDAEREKLAALYQPGQKVWRVPMTHFTPWDSNWPYGPPPDALPPNQPPPYQIKPEDEFCPQPGSIIECQNQILGERIPVTGTSFTLNYRSDRAPGLRALYQLDVPLSGPSVPSGLKRIKLLVSVAGHEYREVFDPLPDLVARFEWDGKDAYGRTVQGQQEAHVLIFYVYDAYYYAVEGQFENSFAGIRGAAGAGGFTAVILPARASLEVEVLQYFEVSVGSQGAPLEQLGGWTLEPHHSYASGGQVLYLGDGTRRSADNLNLDVIHTIAGTGEQDYNGDNIPATEAQLGVDGIAVAPDGTLYLADSRNSRIRRVGTDGIITTVAGRGTAGYSGDDGPATDAKLNYPHGVALGPDGCLYIADTGNHRIRRVGPDGIITTVAGTGVYGLEGDGGPATQAQLYTPFEVAVSPDGALYIADTGNSRVRRVGPDGIITRVAGTWTGKPGDGGLAIHAGLRPMDVDVGPDGSLYIADSFHHRIRRVGTDGIITTVAGTVPASGDDLGDGGLATEARLNTPKGVAVGHDGSICIADAGTNRIRRVDPTGFIRTVAGTGELGYNGDERPAADAALYWPADVAVAPDGNLYVADFGGVHEGNFRVRQVAAVFPELAFEDVVIPSQDGQQLFHFDPNGRHLRTLDALTGAVIHQFTYDEAGRLVAVEDGDGNLTTVERDADGQPTAIIAPFGQRTTLTLDANGYLAGVTNPAGETTHFEYTSAGLLTSMTDARSNTSAYTYDDLGLLVKAEDPAGGFKELSRSTTENGYQVTVTTAMGRATTCSVERLPTGEKRLVNTYPGGLQKELVIDPDGSRTVTYADGTVVTEVYGPDPRWGMLAPVLETRTTTYPSGLERVAQRSRTVTLADPEDPLSLQTMTDTVAVNGAVYTVAIDVAAMRVTTTTPEGRQSFADFDAQGRIVTYQAPGLSYAIHYSYGAGGRLETLTAGPGNDPAVDRVYHVAYDGQGYVQAITNPLDRTAQFAYDDAGRLLLAAFPDGREIALALDASGNLQSFTPPGRPAHTFSYTAANLLDAYAAPTLPGVPNSATAYEYNLDGQLELITRPDGSTVDPYYDGETSRLEKISLPDGQEIDFDYYDGDLLGEPNTGRLRAIISQPEDVSLAYTYDGALLREEAWGGPVQGTVGRVRNQDLRIESRYVNSEGFFHADFTYNDDGLLGLVAASMPGASLAADLSIARDSASGLVTDTILGSVASEQTYNGFGELASFSAAAGGDTLFNAVYDTAEKPRDKLGRIVDLTETVAGVETAYHYEYDTAGRLTDVSHNGTHYAHYAYDANGNRTSYANHETGLVIDDVQYDDQDRLLRYGDTTYTYTPNGELLTKTTSGQTTQYDYDVLGNLKAVTLPDGTQIEYLADGNNRRVGRKENGELVQGFLYQDELNPVAELDGAGNVASLFVYATRSSVPDYMISNKEDGNPDTWAVYRIITDHLGSPRLVVDSAAGQVVQQLDYDEFGNVLRDTNPGFQPFGFAGGLYDPSTGLTRFGARDYDPQVGRWTAKDPIRLAGGDPNFYGYVFGDPVNRTDVSGQGEPSCKSPNLLPEPQPPDLPLDIEVVRVNPDYADSRTTIKVNGEEISFGPPEPGNMEYGTKIIVNGETVYDDRPGKAYPDEGARWVYSETLTNNSQLGYDLLIIRVDVPVFTVDTVQR